jgi:hypothetical protein
MEEQLRNHLEEARSVMQREVNRTKSAMNDRVLEIEAKVEAVLEQAQISY